MRYRPLGNSGLLVSELTLGTLSFGGEGIFARVGEVQVEGARRQIDIATEAGVNLFDTADLYSHGLSEEVLGAALGDKRKDVLVATKVRSPMSDDPNDSGASRYHIMRSVENSLRRLKTDWIDLYQIHNWDGVTPVEETVEAMDRLIQAGKIRYWGTSNYTAWQMMKTLGVAALSGQVKPISQQINYTPESREAEYELLPMALDQNIGTLVWGPMGEGLLTGTVRRGVKTPSTSRQGAFDWVEPYVDDMERAYDIIDLLVEIGEAHGVSAAQVCLAWLKDRPGITSLIVGARTEKHVEDSLAAADLVLTEEETTRIEELTRLRPLYPYWHRFTSGTDRFDPAEIPFLAEHRKTMDAKAKKG